MNTIAKRIRRFTLVFFIIIFLLPQNTPIISAATNKAVYEYSPMLEDRGNIYYILFATAISFALMTVVFTISLVKVKKVSYIKEIIIAKKLL